MTLHNHKAPHIGKVGRWNVIRLTLILLAFMVFYGVIITKLFYWQIVRSEDLKNAGRLQSTESLDQPARRGDIMTGDSFPLATNKYSYLMYANPKVIPDKAEYAKKLSPLIGIEEASISAQLSKDLFWVRLASSLEEDQKAEVEKLKLDGIGFQQNALRYYPEASMAAQLIGFVGKDKMGEAHGYFGVEGYYNGQLSGRSGKLYVIKDALGHPILNDIREEKKIDGRSLTLTLDRTIQFTAEKKLKEGVDKYQAAGGSVIIMDPNDGRILAMASVPEFDPQHYWDFDATSYTNPLISSLYEPGSTFKTLVMAAGIDAGVVKADTKCDICSGPVQVGEYNIKTWDNKYFANTTMTDVIQHSDNTGMVFVGKKLGLSKFVTYLKNFGIGDITHVDLQGETTGVIRNEDEWHTIDEATATFGQGISITPLQLIVGVNAIANGGNIIKPHVVTRITTDEGKVIEIKPEKERRVISDTTSKVVTWMMVNAVENGEAKWVKLKDHKVAGKTGTAQIPVAGHYDPNQTIASFIGFFPAEKPKISMLVIVNKPKTSIYGAETAAPIFFNIAKELINYYSIPPSN